jgi:hypothetical protein
VASTAALTNTGAVALVATDDIWIEANFNLGSNPVIAVFLINVPFGILACLGLWRFMRETSRQEDSSSIGQGWPSLA